MATVCFIVVTMATVAITLATVPVAIATVPDPLETLLIGPWYPSNYSSVPSLGSNGSGCHSNRFDSLGDGNHGLGYHSDGNQGTFLISNGYSDPK